MPAAADGLHQPVFQTGGLPLMRGDRVEPVQRVGASLHRFETFLFIMDDAANCVIT
jgi:hypothetical protein